MIQRRLAWLLGKDDMQICEVFPYFLLIYETETDLQT